MFRYVLISLLFAHVAVAQRQTDVALSTGLGAGALRNEGVSPFIQRGRSPLLGMSFQTIGPRSGHTASLDYAGYSLASGGSQTNLTLGTLQYAWHRRVGTWHGWTVGAGPALMALGGTERYVGSLFADNGDNSWMFALLSASAVASRAVGAGRLALRGDISLLAYAVRPNYALINPNNDTFGAFLSTGTWQTWPNAGQLAARATYDVSFSRRFGGRLTYQWQWLRSQEPYRYGLLLNQFTASLFYQIWP